MKRVRRPLNSKVILVVIIVTIMLVSGCIFREPETGDMIRFSALKDISELKIEMLSGATPSGEYQTETVTFEISPAQCSLHPIDNYIYLKVGELKPYTKLGEPQLPMKTFTVKLPLDAEVIGAEIISGKWVKILNKLNIVPTPQPVSWEKGEKSLEAPQFVPDEKIYSLETYFPGKAISHDVGSDGKQKIVSVRIFPVQYIPKEKEATLITEVSINVYYRRGL